MIPRRLLCLLPICLILLAVPARADLDLYPWDEVDFGALPLGATLVREVWVETYYGAGPDSMDVTVQPPTAPFEVVLGGGFRYVNETAAYLVQVAFTPTAAGDFTADLDFGFGHAPLPLSGHAAADFPDCGLSADEVFFPGTRMDERGLHYLTVTNHGPSPLTLSPETFGVFSVDRTEVVVAPGADHVLQLRFTPPRWFEYLGALNLGTDACRSLQLHGTGDDGPDRLAMYFEHDGWPVWPGPEKSPVGPETGTATINERGLAVGHLYLREPSLAGPIIGFQMSLDLDPALVLLEVEYPGNGVNSAGGLDFVVDYGAALPEPDPGAETFLAKFTFLSLAPAAEAVVRLVPYATFAGAPSVRIYRTNQGWEHVTPSSGLDEIGWIEILSISEVPPAAAGPGTGLRPSVPNPFNPTTEIRWVLGAGGPCRVAVHDLAGRCVRVLCDEARAAGPHAMAWNGRDGQGRTVASGVYYVRLTAGAARDTRKITLLK